MTYRKLIDITALALGIAVVPSIASAQPAPAPPPPPPATPPPAATDPAAPVEAPPPAEMDPAAPPPPAEPPPMTEPPPQTEPPPPPPPEAAPPPPQMYVETPPPEPAMPRNRHFHDGFYLRLSLGPAALWANSSIDVAGVEGDVNYSGAGYVFDIAMGGTPTPGLVIGGALLLQDVIDPDVEIDGPGISGSATVEDTLGFVMIGPMIDGFPDPDGGFHVGGLLGIAGLGIEDKNENAAAGFGLSAWVGYGWWVSSQFSLGLTGRFTGAVTGRELAGGESTETIRSGALMFSMFYH